MATRQFNPFEDRLSRDIRNELSESLLEVIARRSLDPATSVAERFLAEKPAPVYRSYIENRLNRYGSALSALIDAESGCFDRAAVLWDLGLFFEVHEILEPEWIQADGDRKLLLQSLIRAAGVYINLELGYRQRAAKIGAKAIPILKRLKTELNPYLQVERLISALEELNPEPPQLRR